MAGAQLQDCTLETALVGIYNADNIMAAFSVAISAIVFICADPLMRIFVSGAETEIIRIGKEYLRIEGAFYIGIGLLFMLYGYYRAICRPGMSVILTVLSLGTMVALSFVLAPIAGIGELGISYIISEPVNKLSGKKLYPQNPLYKSIPDLRKLSGMEWYSVLKMDNVPIYSRPCRSGRIPTSDGNMGHDVGL